MTNHDCNMDFYNQNLARPDGDGRPDPAGKAAINSQRVCFSILGSQ